MFTKVYFTDENLFYIVQLCILHLQKSDLRDIIILNLNIKCQMSQYNNCHSGVYLLYINAKSICQ